MQTKATQFIKSILAYKVTDYNACSEYHLQVLKKKWLNYSSLDFSFLISFQKHREQQKPRPAVRAGGGTSQPGPHGPEARGS